MKREDLEKLLGGYAAGTLTAEERRALLEAAVSDQALFDALAMEEPLRDTLADEAARARVLAALEAPAPRFADRFAAWLGRPQAWALGASVAGAVVLTVVALRFEHAPQPAPPPPRQEIAELRPAQPEPPAAASTVKPKRLAAKVRPERTQVQAPATAPQLPPTAAAPLDRALTAPPPPRAPREQALPPLPPPRAVSGAVSETMRVAPQRGELLTAGHLGGAAAPAPEVTWRPGTEARALFVAHHVPQAPAPNTAAPPGLGLRYTLLRRDVVGAYFEVPADTEFSPGEAARLRIEANEPGYLYVLGDRGTLFSGPVGAHNAVTIDVQPATLRAVLAREPDPGPIETVAWRTRAQLRGVRLDLEAPAQLRPRDPSVYVVNPSAAPDARVFAEIRINSR
jgi:hypothetical protein